MMFSQIGIIDKHLPFVKYFLWFWFAILTRDRHGIILRKKCKNHILTVLEF